MIAIWDNTGGYYRSKILANGTLAGSTSAPTVSITDIISSDTRILDLTGSYNVSVAGEPVSLSLMQDGGSITGTAQAGADSFPVKGTLKGKGSGLALKISGKGTSGANLKLSGSYADPVFGCSVQLKMGGHTLKEEVQLAPESPKRGLRLTRNGELWTLTSGVRDLIDLPITVKQSKSKITLSGGNAQFKIKGSATVHGTGTVVFTKLQVSFGKLKYTLIPDQVEVLTESPPGA